MRLQKYLAEAGVCSRRKAEQLILDGRVHVNGNLVIELGVKVLPGKDRVLLDGREVSVEEKALFLFHKPSGVISTLEDDRGRRCLRHYLRGMESRLFPIGRLDADVTGLLLLTNDGDYAHSLLHPRFEVEREYFALVDGHISQKALRRLEQGIMLEDGLGKAKSATIASGDYGTLLPSPSQGESLVRLVVSQGRKHFVKNLLKESGYPVQRLIRTSFGPYRLGKLGVGDLKQVDFCG